MRVTCSHVHSHMQVISTVPKCTLIWLVGLGVIRVNLGCYQGNGAYAHINMYDILTNRVRALKSTLGIALLFVVTCLDNSSGQPYQWTTLSETKVVAVSLRLLVRVNEPAFSN